MKINIFNDADAVACAAAKFIAVQARTAVSVRGRFVMALSGGSTPLKMLRALTGEDVPWSKIHIVQVDERMAPAGHADRHLTHLRECLLDHVPLDAGQIHAMPVEEKVPEAAVENYAGTLRQIAGLPPIFDLVHLGLGSDGHTASLVPQDPVLEITGADVALTGIYRGWRRMTLTYPVINRSRCVLWLVTGIEKNGMLARLLKGDSAIPAGRIRREQAVVFADRDAAENCC